MPSRDDEPQPDLDEFDVQKRINFRDYPSTGLVAVAALLSGLSWVLYKWSGKKRADTASDPETKEPKG